MRRRPSAFFFLTPVWGESYTRLYVDTVIPAQLASGNLAAFREDSGNRYIIYTRPADAEVIRSSAIFAALNACVPVTFEFISDRVNVVHDRMTDCYRRGIEAAEKADAAVVFLTPDIVLSDGSFKTIKHLSDDGWDVIYIPAIRTMKKAVATRLAKSFGNGEVIQIQPRQLMRIAMDNLHPLADASWWEEGEGGLLPANIYWRVGDEGIVARCFHLHPILVFPQRKGAKFFGTVDDDYVPAACPDSNLDFVVNDSDQLLAIELSDPGRFVVSRLAKGSVADAARWAEEYTDERHRRLFKIGIRMHTGILEPDKWLETEDRARAIAQEIQTRLARPAWRLLFDADLLVSRFGQWVRENQVKLVNRSGYGSIDEIPTWKMGTLSAVRALADIRSSLVGLIRRTADKIETLAAKPYRAKLRLDLVDALREASDPVLISNNPDREYLAPLLSRVTSFFSGERYVSLLRRNSVIFLENGEPIFVSSKDVVVLEVDAERTKDVELYLRESKRVLSEHGHLIVYLHRLGLVCPSDDKSNRSLEDIIERLGAEFQVITIRHQGGLGSYLRVRLASWFRGLVSRRLAVRWLLLIFGLPLLPIIIVAGGLFVASTAVLDFFARSNRYRISSLILARSSLGRP